MHYQTIWLILLIVFAGIEGITAGLVSIWFCAGSLVALVATWLGASLPVQIGLFAIVSVVAMALVRPMATLRWRKPTQTASWIRKAWWWRRLIISTPLAKLKLAVLSGPPEQRGRKSFPQGPGYGWRGSKVSKPL